MLRTVCFWMLALALPISVDFPRELHAQSIGAATPARIIYFLSAIHFSPDDLTMLPLRDRHRAAESLNQAVPVAEQRVRRELEGFEHGSFQTRFIRLASQADLWNALRDPNAAAVIWFGHGAFFDDQTRDGMSVVSPLVDVFGHDLAPVFQTANPNLRALAVVGCSAGPILSSLWPRFHMTARFPNLFVHAPSATINSHEGMTEALEFLRRVLASPNRPPRAAEPPTARAQLQVRITRVIPPTAAGRAPALRVETDRGEILAVFPSGAAGETQQVLTSVPGGTYDFFSSSLLKLVFQAGDLPQGRRAREPLELGELSVEPLDRRVAGRWEVLTTRSGQPVGHTRRVLRYTGMLPPREFSN